MVQSNIRRWTVFLDDYNMIIEHRTRDKHRKADGLSKKTEIKDGISFMEEDNYDSLSLTRWLGKSGKLKEDHPELPADD